MGCLKPLMHNVPKWSALFVLKIFKFLSRLLGHVEKTARLENKVSFKIHDVATWLTNNCHTHCSIPQEVKATRQWNMVS